MKKLPIIVIVFVFCLTTAALANEGPEKKSIYRDLLGEDTFLTIGFLPIGFVKGHNTYHITFDNPWDTGGHVECELEWPINNFLLGAELNAVQKNPQNHRQDRVKLNMAWFISVNEKTSNKMKDSDWLGNDDYYDDGVINGSTGQHAGKDIYSESDADLDKGHIVDVNYAYNFWPLNGLERKFENFDFGFGPILGYRYHYFSHAARSLDQIGYGPYAAGHTHKDLIGNTWGKYKLHEHMFYLGGNIDILLSDNFGFNVRGGYIPWISIRDEDTHLYPTSAIGHTMVSTGDCEGDGGLLNMSGNWEFYPDCTAELGAEYFFSKATGHMEQKHYIDGMFWYSAEAAGLKEWVSTSYWTFSGKIKFRF
ncbi:MAG: hypothetical protein U9Q08_02555 [Candidatus Omnitrophota bacterium]|nr:hypothetical protein [Candidatus Omnitrophota bacterium]